VLTSVHAFASDPMRGIFILGILVLFIGGALTLFAWRAQVLKQGGLFAPISREGALVLNNLFLTVCCATVFIGTLWPLVTEAWGDKISVGAPYFDWTFGPLFALLLAVVPFGPLLAWKRGDLKGVTQRLTAAFVLALVGILVVCVMEGRPVLGAFGVGMAAFVIVGALTDVVERTGLWRAAFPVTLRRAAGLPRSAWGTMFAHIGLGITLLGIVGETQWGSEQIVSLRPGDKVSLRHYDFTFEGTGSQAGPNYQELAARFAVRRNGELIGEMVPAKKSFQTRGMTTSEAALMTRGVSQIYLSLGDVTADGAIAVRLYHKPLVLMIWLGAVVMAIGGAFSLSDRRLRVGAPKPAKARAVLQPAE
jgi:cytochrome c-type biogenesis protein CcmF